MVQPRWRCEAGRSENTLNSNGTQTKYKLSFPLALLKNGRRVSSLSTVSSALPLRRRARSGLGETGEDIPWRERSEVREFRSSSIVSSSGIRRSFVLRTRKHRLHVRTVLSATLSIELGALLRTRKSRPIVESRPRAYTLRENKHPIKRAHLFSRTLRNSLYYP